MLFVIALHSCCVHRADRFVSRCECLRRPFCLSAIRKSIQLLLNYTHTNVRKWIIFL